MHKHLTRQVAATMILASNTSHFLARSHILAGIFFGLTVRKKLAKLFDGFNRCEVFDKLFAPAHTIYQRPTLMRDRSKPDRQPSKAMPYAVLFAQAIGQPGGPDIVRRAEAPSWATLPCLTSGRATTASYLEQSGQRPIPVDPVGMAERLGVVTVDRVG